MEQDTEIGGPRGKFPVTHRSVILAARSADPAERARGLEVLVATYWKPVYKYIRLRWKESNENAKDLAQGFFARAIEKNFFQGFDPARASFRTYLRTCLDGFISNERKSARRLKRAGDSVLARVDFEEAETELEQQPEPQGISMEEYFHREWVRSLFSQAVDTLREMCLSRGKEVQFRIFELYDLAEADAGARVTYEALGRQFGISTVQVTNYLAFARREFRRVLLEKLREITGSEREFRREARALLGTGAP